MAKRRKTKTKKFIRKHPVLTFIIILLVLAIVGTYVLHTKGIIHIPFLNENFSHSEESSSAQSSTVIAEGEMEIHFLQLGNEVSGDSTLIKVGDTEVLIDAGSMRGSAETVVPYIQQYCTDGILEYVIATHAHEDHIAALVGSSTADGVLESFTCQTIIDFPKTTSKTQLYQEYVDLRDAEVNAGAKHYTALECYNNVGGAQRTYTLGEGITMQILYQKYYEESTSKENNNSVCTLISYGDNHFLFTGDLERSGELSLIEENDLPKCKLYKAGHHGSDTSSSAELLAVIQPEIVVANCCCGDKHGFPKQQFLENISIYTDKLYIPVMNDNGYKLLNGNIVVSVNNGQITVNGSNNNTLFKDTDWFKENRTCPDAWE